MSLNIQPDLSGGSFVSNDFLEFAARRIAYQRELEAFQRQQEEELAAFDREAELTPQQLANTQSLNDIAQSRFDADVFGAESGAAAASQQQELRDRAITNIRDPSAQGAPGQDFERLQSELEANRLAQRGSIAEQRQFINDILAEQQNLTAGQKELISQAANQAISLGKGDIQTNLKDALTILREELAPARGLRSTDSPIIDRGGRLATESLRLGERLTSQVRGGETAALLELPREQRAFQLSASDQIARLIAQESALDTESSTAGLDFARFKSDLSFGREELDSRNLQFQQQFGQALSEFQNQLKNEAFNRNLAETSLAGQLGLGLSSIGPSGVGFDVGTTSTTSGPGLGTLAIPGLAQGAGVALGTPTPA